MLKKRLITALILIPLILLAILFLPRQAFELFILFISALIAWEWARLAGFNQWFDCLLFIVGSLACCLLVKRLPLFIALSIALLVWLWASAVVLRYQRKLLSSGLTYSFLKAVSGLIIISTSTLSILVLREHQLFFLFQLLLIVWISDSGAYFCGKIWGKGRATLADKVSPNKTWVGFWGGFILASVVTFSVSFFMPMPLLQRLGFLFVIMITALFSVSGDLFISVLKRIAKVKDTSNLLPGHGGVLDRIDSLLAAAPVFTLGLLLLKL